MIDECNYQLVLPIRITVAKIQNFLNEEFGPELFNAKHERLFEFTRPTISETTYAVFDENVFVKLISIKNIEDCEQFLKLYPDLSYFFFEMTDKQKSKLLRKNDYMVTMFNDIALFNRVRSIYEALIAYIKTPNDKSNLNGFLNVYLGNYKMIYSPINHDLEIILDKYNIEDLLTDNILDNVFLSDISDILMPEIDSPDLCDGIQLGDVFRNILVSACASAIDQYIQERLRNIKIIQQLKDLVSEYRCDTLSEAMYEYLLVSAYNKDTYRVCAKEKCSTYFCVNKSHPQLFCERHMASRRKKDTKYKRKQRLKDKESLQEV